MFHVLQFVAVLATVICTVLSTDLHNCPEVYYDYFEGGFKSRYEIHPIRTVISISDFNIEGSFPDQAVYAYSSNAAVDYMSNVKEVQFGARLKDRKDYNGHNSSLSWSYIFLVAATANIVPEVGTGFYKVDDRGCQIYTFTIEEHWQYKNQDSIEASVKFPLDRYNIPATLKMAVRNVTMSCLNAYICARASQVLRTARPNPQEKNFPFRLSVGIKNAVDRSLRRFREDIRKHHAEKIDIGNVTVPFSANVVAGNFHGVIVATGGTFENLSMIERVGNATAKIDANGYYITSTYTFPEARVHFDNYKFQFEKVPFSGEMSITIQDLEIQVMRSAVRHFSVCNKSLSLNVTKIDKLQYEFSGYDLLDSTLSSVWRWISSPWEVEMKKVLRVYLAENLLLYGAANYSDNIFGPCMSNSSKA